MLALKDKHRLSMAYQAQYEPGNAWLAFTFKGLTVHRKTSPFIINLLPNCFKYAIFRKYLHLLICLEMLPMGLTLAMMNQDKIFLMMMYNYSMLFQKGTVDSAEFHKPKKCLLNILKHNMFYDFLLL